MESEIKYKDCSIVIDYDEYINSPRIEYSNLGTIYANSYKYNPDNKMLEDYFDKDNTINWELLKKDYIYLPVYCYIHSGISLWCKDTNEVFTPGRNSFDTALFGIIAVEKKQARKEYGNLTKRSVNVIKTVLRNEIEDLNSWYNGECYTYTILNGNGDVLDSCSGFLGDIGKEHLIDYAKDYIDDYLKTK